MALPSSTSGSGVICRGAVPDFLSAKCCLAFDGSRMGGKSSVVDVLWGFGVGAAGVVESSGCG